MRHTDRLQRISCSLDTAPDATTTPRPRFKSSSLRWLRAQGVLHRQQPCHTRQLPLRLTTSLCTSTTNIRHSRNNHHRSSRRHNTTASPSKPNLREILSPNKLRQKPTTHYPTAGGANPPPQTTLPLPPSLPQRPRPRCCRLLRHKHISSPNIRSLEYKPPPR